MAKDGLVQATIRGYFWVNASFYAGKLLVFVSTMILARLLTQEDFGLAGYALVFIAFMDSIGNLGLGMALIYYPDDPESSDTMFWMNMLLAVMMMALTWALAPLAGMFFQDERAVALTRVMGCSYPISALGGTHSALISKSLSFGKKFIPDVAQSATRGVVSIVLALLGFGAWSLILSQLAGTLAAALAYWWVYPWRPGRRLNLTKGRKLLSFGFGAFSINLLSVALLNIDYLFVGRFLGAAALGVYTLAFRMPELLIKQIYSSLAPVLFPAYTTVRDDLDKLKTAFLSTMRYVSLITVPLGLGLALVAKPFIIVFFGEKWLEAVPVMQAIALFTMILSFMFNAGDLLKAQGRLALMSLLALVRLAITIPVLWWAATVVRSTAVVAWSQTAIALVTVIYTMLVVGRVFGANLRGMLSELSPAIIAGTPMALALLLLLPLLVNAPALVQMALAVLTGGAVYLGVLWLTQRQMILEARGAVATALKRRTA